LIVGAGAIDVGTIRDWVSAPGSVVSWRASPASLAKARQAAISAVPPSYMQAQHLRGFRDFATRGLDYSRLVIASMDVPGRCDVRAMTYLINSHLRRHDTYRSWFEYTDAEHIVRHTICDPADIEFVPVKHGEMTRTEWQDHILATPDPLQWDCFRTGIIQRADHFTCYLSVDHLHCDPMLIAVWYWEIYMRYFVLVKGAAPTPLPETGSYDDYCIRQRQYTSTLTLDSPQVRQWVEFAENNDGTLPVFPLPIGDTSVNHSGEMFTVQLMDARQTARFESACTAAGARFSGGLFAAAALAQYQLTGEETYYGLTPVDMRNTQADIMTTGWLTGVVPFAVPVGAASFADTVRAAQTSFDSNMDLANVPFDRVLELAPWLGRPGPNSTMLNYMDAALPPFSAAVFSQFDDANARLYNDGRAPAHIYMSVGRLFDDTSMSVSFPNNPVARESVTRYVQAMKSVCHRVAEGSDALVSRAQCR
jgi:mycolipenoyl-CoA---2-(long-chain-fatty acyl)-trehalose mycolipenoyltransferase / long-chain-acyl-CoA---trehalose acyltransferase